MTDKETESLDSHWCKVTDTPEQALGRIMLLGMVASRRNFVHRKGSQMESKIVKH